MPSTANKMRNQRRMSINNISVKTKYNVQHRSDLLMDEHVRNVKQVQYELQSTLQELESAKTPTEIEELKSEVADLKARSQKLVLSLQVMDKINTELTFARADLKDSLHKGIGDINAARKRVIWLEDKMGELCGKKRLKTRRPSNRFVTDPTYGWDTDSEGEQTLRRMRPLDSSERMYASEQARHQSLTQLLGSEIGFTSDSEHVVGRQVGFQDISSQSYDSHDISHSRQKVHITSQEDVSLTEGDTPGPPRILDHRKSLHDSINSLTSGGHEEIAEESDSEKFSTKKELSVVAASLSRQESSEGDRQDSYPAHSQIEDGSDDEERAGMKHKQNEDGDSQQAYYVETPDSTGSGRQEYEEEEDDGKERGEDYEDEEAEEEGRGSYEEANEEEEEEEERKEEEPGGKKTFITEFDGQKDEEDNKEDQKEEERVTELESHRDYGTEYWQSEHHRFEYSQFKDILSEIDPLSYHQVGLAVPGSFIKKEDTGAEYEELPWRARRKGSDIKDIHRIALDKLAARVHGLYDKVYNATMLSVRMEQQDLNLPRETSVFQSLDSGRVVKPSSSSTRSSGPPQSAPASIRQKTEDKLPLPVEKEMRRGRTFVTKHLVFYPKPIPPPQVLPITRTSLNKEFPQFASSFSKPDPDSRKPAERLVDQRNLLEETKLVLYREKVKASAPGPNHLERKFRKMIERDGVISNKSSGKKLKASFKTGAIMAKFQGALSSWNQIKPQSRGKEYAGLRWERVKTIVHMNLQSERIEERIDGVRQLGLLRCGDTMVFYALKEKLHNDPEDRVKYEAAKSLILIGCWEDEVIQHILKYLVLGNTEIRMDLIQTLSEGKNVQYVHKSIPSIVELVKVLSHFCRNPDPDDLIAFNSAVCLGKLCVRDESAQARLIKAMEESKDTHIKAKALEILVKQLGLLCINDSIVQHIHQLLQFSPVWRHRALACRLLIALGPKHECILKSQEEVYNLLERSLWDDPNMDVRLAAAKALTALGMFSRACETVERKLEDAEEDARAQAAIAVGTLGMKSEKLIRLLLEMLELDASDYVRLMIIRTFGVLKLTDKRVLRCLREREKLEGALAREARKALRILDQVLASQANKTSTQLSARKYLHSRRVLSPILAGVV